MNKYLTQVVAMITALATVGGLAWAFGDYTGIRPIIKKEFLVIQAQMEQLSKSELQLQFNFLLQKREYGGLTFQEQQQLCQIAVILQYVQVPGC